jgi:putative FmdB family regulatory protein
MPIYAYKCESCGHRQDVLQKISDPVLTDCPACGAATFAKQVTAAGFQLKGSGWYATDFRNSGTQAPAESKDDGKTDAAPAPEAKPADKPADKPALKETGSSDSAASPPPPAPAPSAGA